MRGWGFVLGLAVCWGVCLAALGRQEVLPPSRYFQGMAGERWFTELYVLPLGDSLWVSVLVRVPYATLGFEQEPLRGGFRASLQLGVEFTDSLGIVRRRLERADTVWAQRYETTLSRDSAWVRAFEVWVPPTVVRCRLRLLLGRQEVREEAFPLTDTDGRFRWRSPLLALATGRAEIVPFVLGGAIPFGAPAARVMLWDARIRQGELYTYRCMQAPPEPDTFWWDSTPELRGTVRAELRGRLLLQHPEVPRYWLQPDTLGGWVECFLPTAELVPGRYEFVLLPAESASQDTLRWSFRVVWSQMPLPLQRLSYAIRSMRHILSDDDWDELRRGSEHEQWRKLWQYWKQRDPTPATAYNEAMAVYFRRVEHAYFAFRSVTESDGAQTVRGTVYILYGEPTRTERVFPPGGQPREVWIYERLRKRFLFELRPDGRWHLVNIEQL